MCVEDIFQEMGRVSNEAITSDDFLPVLIYVILQSNPPNLCTQLKFIQVFGSDEYVSANKASYYITNFEVAVEFIKQYKDQMHEGEKTKKE